MAEHTPGPWEADTADWPESVDIVYKTAMIAKVYGPEAFPCLDDEEKAEATNEMEMNWHLIKAAPDLLEALKRVAELAQEHGCDGHRESHGQDPCFICDLLEAVEPAISKAQGE